MSVTMPPHGRLILELLRIGQPGFIKAGVLNEWMPHWTYKTGELVYDADAPRFVRANPPLPHKRGYGLFFESLADGNQGAVPHKTPAKWRPVDELDPVDGVGKDGGGTLDVYVTHGDVEIRPQWLPYVAAD